MTPSPRPDSLHGTLYSPKFERDACGIGFIADLAGNPSRAVVERALEAACNLAHRGGTNADALTGDGAGLMTQVPHPFFAQFLESQGVDVPEPGRLAVGMIFLPKERHSGDTACQVIEQALVDEEMTVLAWRDVPVDPSAIGRIAADSRPRVRQVLLSGAADWDNERLERRLYRARRRIERDLTAHEYARACVCSLSSRTIVYKGMLVADQLRSFYPDLLERTFVSAVAMFHQRYSTNTFPSWERAQPFRMLAHNGEINTLQGNVNWFRARQADLESPVIGPALHGLGPVIDEGGSDSGMLDNVLELLVRGGRDVRHAISMLAPQAWEQVGDVPEDIRAFHAYHAALMEPWDGPAALAFCDGRWVGAALDRNGLRPVRYLVTGDGMVACASEAGVIDVDDAGIIAKGKLGPGQMLAVDCGTGRLYLDHEIKHELAALAPYGEWVEAGMTSVDAKPGDPLIDDPQFDEHELLRLQAAFGFTREELTVVLRPMLSSGAEPIGSMGDDTPQAILATRHRALANYFKQRFAEVTNPPIDPLRESLVMSLTTLIGSRRNVLAETPEHAEQIRLGSPILSEPQLRELRNEAERRDWLVAEVPTAVDAARIATEIPALLDELCAQAEVAVRAGARIVVLSDRDVSPVRAALPSLLAVGAVHHHLIRCGLRMHASLVAESGEPREVHHFATLIGYGANAVCPYVALATVRVIAAEPRVRNAGIDDRAAVEHYVKALDKGLDKVMSKMGIATIDSYCAAQVFEAVGVADEVLDRCFTGTPSRLGGIGFARIGEAVERQHRIAFPLDGEAPSLDSPGFYKFKRDGEPHVFNPANIKVLHRAVLTEGASDESLEEAFAEGYAHYEQFAQTLRDQPATELRDLLDFVDSDSGPVPLDQVEAVSDIVRRFSTGAMSLGSLSPEAHETLAVAMNRLRGMSNSGEGGEDPARFGTEKNSAIKQVASARFGVTPAYLMSARELQIKMAQGSKPGEGGQLPGHKVSGEIARIRHTIPGVALISPPPHHDIYSIEDLAQLIYDLKQVNPAAHVSVKLVGQAGVGTIAAGVAKGYADAVLISGHAGGTGASPLGSIKNAGLPWELGLSETQQTLVANGLRGRVRLRADGGLRTGRDVMIAALLGADEYSFGTAALVAEGCLMARTCHNNQCPVGIATQRADLRAKYTGTPERVMAYMLFVAHEVRTLLARLGLRSLDEAVGRTDLLDAIDAAAEAGLDMSPLLAKPDVPADWEWRGTGAPNPVPASSQLNEHIVRDAWPALIHGERLPNQLHRSYAIHNTDRAIGARLAGEIARRWGDDGLPAGTVQLEFRGSAGQSFAAFCPTGMSLTLAGEANDYVGKGLAGATVAVHPPRESAARASHEHHIAGNTCLYGATSGRLFLAGRAGERFAVRNSGAEAVVEGIGDHGCEYMTGGAVVVLGTIGRNFAAGMTGGVAYVLDPDARLATRCNTELVTVGSLDAADCEHVRMLVQAHVDATGSVHATALLDDWPTALAAFRRVAPLAAIAEIENANDGATEAGTVVPAGA